MRTLLLFDQVQAGYGGKERGDTELGLEKGGVGSYLMFKDDFEKAGLTALATIYCGPDYFQAHKEEVIHKIKNLILKTKAEVLFAGPCFNYGTYAQMAAEIALAIQEQTDCKPYVICSKENEETIGYDAGGARSCTFQRKSKSIHYGRTGLCGRPERR